MTEHDDAAKALVEGFRKITCVKSIVAYGSYARGDYRKDSDIDLAVLLDFQVFSRSDAIKLIKCVRQVQRKYRIRLEPDFFLDGEIELANQGILLDGRTLSDAYMFKRDGKILFGQDFRDLFKVPRRRKLFAGNLFAIIEQHFKGWLLHNIKEEKVPNWMVSWTIVTAANVGGSVEIASREESLAALEKLIPKINSLSAYRKFKKLTSNKKEHGDVLTPDEFLELFKSIELSTEKMLESQRPVRRYFSTK